MQASFPDSFTLVANVEELPHRTVRLFANLDGRQEATGEPVLKVKVHEGDKARISDAAPDVEDIDTGIVRYEAPKRADAIFVGWSTKHEADEVGTYYPGDSMLQYGDIPDGGIDLFAVWTQDVFSEIDYQGNGGTSADGDSVVDYESGAKGTIGIAANPFARDGYVFTGWNTKADGSGLAIAAGSDFALEDLIKSAQSRAEVEAALQEGKLVLYAQWKERISIKVATVSGIGNATWTGKALAPKPVVKLAGKTLRSGVDYTVTYKSNKNVGAATATVTGQGAYIGTLDKTFKINPKGTSVQKLTGAKKALGVTWKKQAKKMSTSRITGYQVRVATNAGFTKNKKTVTVKGYKKTLVKVGNLKAGKKYYVRVRTYKAIGAMKYHSPWSKAKQAKTR